MRCGRRLSTARAASRSTAARESAALLGAALVAQLVLGNRHDYVAHVVGGGAVALAVGVAMATWAPAWGPARAGLVAVAAAAVSAVLVERVLFGPFDVVDVVFTVAGALLVGPSQGGVLRRSERASVAAAAIVLAVAALVFRHWMGVGPS